MKNNYDEIREAQRIIKSVFHAHLRQNNLSLYSDYGRCFIYKKSCDKMGISPGMYVTLVVLANRCWFKFSRKKGDKLVRPAYGAGLYFFSKRIARKVISLSNVPHKRIGRFRFIGGPVVEKDGTIWCRLDNKEVVDIYSISEKMKLQNID